MLLYSRVSPRPSCLKLIESSSEKEQRTAEVIHGDEQSVEQSVESSHSIFTNSELKDSVQMDVFSSTSISDDVEMDDTILSLSSPQDIGVFSNGELKAEDIVSSDDTDGLESPHSELGISIDELMHSFNENPQCLEDGKIALSEQNHCDSKSLPDFNDSKQEREKLETENSFSTSNGGKIASKANGEKVKPFLTPGFLGKRPGSNSVKRHGKCPTNVGEFAHPTEPSFLHENLQAKDGPKPHPESIDFFSSPSEN